MTLSTKVKCPYCGVEHSVRFDDTLKVGWNVVTCYSGGDSLEATPATGCNKEFIVYCVLAAVELYKMEQVA